MDELEPLKFVKHCRCEMKPVDLSEAHPVKDPTKSIHVIVTKKAVGCYHKAGDVVLAKIKE
jgi:hypothetical protein